jgi:hypothetical protein
LASGANRIDDTEEFSSDVTDGHGMMFVHLLPVAVIEFSKTGLMEASHAGGLIESGAQGNAAAFAHFDFAAPLATFAHAGIRLSHLLKNLPALIAHGPLNDILPTPREVMQGLLVLSLGTWPSLTPLEGRASALAR